MELTLFHLKKAAWHLPDSSARQKHSPFALQEDLEALPLQLQFSHSDRNIHQKQNQAAFSYMDVLLLQQASHSPEFPQFFPDT